jgi:hypothetical protein
MGFEAILKINSSKSKTGSDDMGYGCVTDQVIFSQAPRQLRRYDRFRGSRPESEGQIESPGQMEYIFTFKSLKIALGSD